MTYLRFHGLLALGLLTAALGAAFSPAGAQAQVVIEIAVEAPPRRIESYPHTYYANRRVYFANGHWYYRRGPRWYYYRSEPRELRHHRVTVFEGPGRHYHEHRGHHRAHRDDRHHYKKHKKHHRHERKHHRRDHHHRPHHRHDSHQIVFR